MELQSELQQRWLEELRQRNAFWKHDGRPKRPHALLTSGLHSDGFVNWGEIVFNKPRLAEEACHDLVKIFCGLISSTIAPQQVIGPAFGAISLACEVAKAFGPNVGFGFSIPFDGKSESFKKSRVMEKRFKAKDKLFIGMEDVITTGESVEENILAALRDGGLPMPFILALTNRSGLKSLTIKGQEYPIIALIDQPMNNWDEKDCPLCQLGSQAIRPKEADNWALLNGNYPIAA